MRRLLFIGLFLFANTCYSQNYVEVYRCGLLGVMNLEQNHPDEAEKYLRKALELIPDKTVFSAYFQLIKIAYAHNDRAKISEYLTELSCIYPKDTIYKYLGDFSEISMKYDVFDSLYHPKCKLIGRVTAREPKALDSIIASLRDRDQAVRKKLRNSTLTEAQVKEIKNELKYVDSTNFPVLRDCIKKYGFPRLDSDYLQGSRITLIMHIDNYSNFKQIDEYLLAAINQGCLNPANYAYAMDRSLVASGLRPKYYWFIPETDDDIKYKPSADELKKANAARKAIGLPTYPNWIGWGFL